MKVVLLVCVIVAVGGVGQARIVRNRRHNVASCPTNRPFICPNYYGSCVGYTDFCNGVLDCPDGSDERRSLCAAPCPAGFIQATEGSSCYKFVHDPRLSWHNASLYCRSLHRDAHLVFIDSQTEQEYIETSLRESEESQWWTGGEKPTSSGEWTWARHLPDGRVARVPMTFTNWALGEPNNRNNGGTDESCVELMHMEWWDNHWNNNNCEAQIARFICELDD